MEFADAQRDNQVTQRCAPSRTAHAGRTRRMPPRRTRCPPNPARHIGTRHAGRRRARCTGLGTAAGLRGRRRPRCRNCRAHSCIRRRHTCHGRSTTRPRSLRGIRRTRSRGRATRPRAGSNPPRTAHARSNRSDSAAPRTSLASTLRHSRTSRCGRRRRGCRTRADTRRFRTRRQPRSRRRGRRRSGTRRARCNRLPGHWPGQVSWLQSSPAQPGSHTHAPSTHVPCGAGSAAAWQPLLLPLMWPKHTSTTQSGGW